MHVTLSYEGRKDCENTWSENNESGELNEELVHDSGPGQHRMLIFCRVRNLVLLENCPNWYADGTFKTSPPLFKQVYTIHVLK